MFYIGMDIAFENTERKVCYGQLWERDFMYITVAAIPWHFTHSFTLLQDVVLENLIMTWHCQVYSWWK